jgi:hypothetical protein
MKGAGFWVSRPGFVPSEPPGSDRKALLEAFRDICPSREPVRFMIGKSMRMAMAASLRGFFIITRPSMRLPLSPYHASPGL